MAPPEADDSEMEIELDVDDDDFDPDFLLGVSDDELDDSLPLPPSKKRKGMFVYILLKGWCKEL